MLSEWTHVSHLKEGASYNLWIRESVFPERFRFLRTLGRFTYMELTNMLEIRLVFEKGVYIHQLNNSFYQETGDERSRTLGRTEQFKEELIASRKQYVYLPKEGELLHLR